MHDDLKMRAASMLTHTNNNNLSQKRMSCVPNNVIDISKGTHPKEVLLIVYMNVTEDMQLYTQFFCSPQYVQQ